jgi:flagellum-specific peptidoglycan hydrolase FlgJ
MCNPAFINKRAPCQDGDLFVSFVRHLKSKNAVPTRGTCYCVSRNALAADQDSPVQMTAFESSDPRDYNALDDRFIGQVGMVDITGHSATPVWSNESRFVRDPLQPKHFHRYLESAKEMYRISENAEHAYTLDPGLKQRETARAFWEASQTSPEWTTKDGKERDPLRVGIESELYQKDGVFAEYAERTVKSLGTEYSPFSLFHNAWKLSRLTRANNDISLKAINDSVRKQLSERFKDPLIVARLMPKYEAFNKYIWETMHTKAQEMHPQFPDSHEVDDHFKASLLETPHNGHREMWSLLADLDNEAHAAIAAADPAKVGKAITLAEARKIQEYSAPKSACGIDWDSVYKKAPQPYKNFLKKLGPLSEKLAPSLGIPLDGLLAQMGYESGWGKSDLATQYHNYGGVKARKGYPSTPPLKTYEKNRTVVTYAKFSLFSSAEEYIRFKVDFVAGPESRYKSCAKRPTNASTYSWALCLGNEDYHQDTKTTYARMVAGMANRLRTFGVKCDNLGR